LAQLRASKKGLFIRNNTQFLWTLREKLNGQELDIELRPSGQPGSIAFLPAAALESSSIVRNFTDGKVTISPDLEEELVTLGSNPSINHNQNILDDLKLKLKVEDAPAKRDIDAKDITEGLINKSTRREVRQSRFGNDIDEFTNPSPVAIGDKVVDVMTGEIVESKPEESVNLSDIIKSVTVTRSSRVVEEN
jgi:hypothetical protein